MVDRPSLDKHRFYKVGITVAPRGMALRRFTRDAMSTRRSLPCDGSDRVAQGRVEEKRPVSPRSCATSVGKIRVPQSPSRLTVVPGSMRRGGTLTTASPTRHFRTRPVSTITRTSANFICCVSSNIAVPSRHRHDRVACILQREYFYVPHDAGGRRPVSCHAPGTSLAVAKGTGYIMPVVVHVGISTPNFIVQLPPFLDLLIRPS